MSSVSAVMSGVPQGTVWSSTIVLFADDGYIYRSTRNIDDRKILKEDLQKLI